MMRHCETCNLLKQDSSEESRSGGNQLGEGKKSHIGEISGHGLFPAWFWRGFWSEGSILVKGTYRVLGD